MQVLEFVLKSRVKYVTIVIFCLFCIILYLSGNGDHSLEEQQLGLIQYKKNANDKILSIREINRHGGRLSEDINKLNDGPDPADFQVQFISGKEAANEVDNEHKSFQVHRVKLVNHERSKILIQCQDPFSSFGKAIPAGGSYEFRVTDLFARRHYWCAARYGSSEFIFKAYGEGAPRDNNIISLYKSGAFINGKSMNIEDSPLRAKLPSKSNNMVGVQVDSGEEQQQHQQMIDHQEHPPEDRNILRL